MTFKVLLVACFAAAASLTPANAAEIVPKEHVVLDNDEKPSTVQAVCKSLASETRPNVVASREDGDSVFCTVGDGKAEDDVSQHTGSISTGCPANSGEIAGGRCECEQGFKASGAKCVPALNSTAETEQRRYPDQTCPNDVLDRLQAEKNELVTQIPKRDPNDTGNEKRAAKLPCSYIVQRLNHMTKIKAKRQEIQDACFGGRPDPGHEEQLEAVDNSIEKYEALKKTNCAPGHPMETR